MRLLEGARGRRQEQPLSGRGGSFLLGLAGVLCLIAIVQILPSVGVVSRSDLPTFTTMISTLGDQMGTNAFWSQLGATIRGWAIGLVISLVAGVVLGFVIGSVPLLRQVTASTIEFLRPIPSVALVPLVVLLYGTGMRSTLVLVVYGGFWQVIVQVMYGVQDVDPVARDTARSYRLSTWRQVRTLLWPTALPYIVTGMRLAATVALVLEVTGELVIGSPGLGQGITTAQAGGQTPTVYALAIVVGLLGVILNVIVRMTERRVLRWHPTIRAEAVS